MDARPLSEREQAVLDKLLSIDFEGADRLRQQAPHVQVVGLCGCGCPSIDFVRGRGQGMSIEVNASVRGRQYDGLFLWTIDDADRGVLLGGIEWLGNSEEPDPEELPDPALLDVTPA